MRIKVNGQIFISEITVEDKPSYINHFKEREIYENTVAIPFPYGSGEADWWINAVTEETRRFGVPLKWAIRKDDSELIGGISLMNMAGKKDHGAEIGFWLAKPYWNKGIMTNCVKKFVEWSFLKSGLELVRIQARAFASNDASVRVLEKASFDPEGYMRKRFFKDGKYVDAKLFAIIR